VHERLPLAWGDTYTQNQDGQNFNVTSLLNGTYYVEVIANPEKVIHETNMANNTTLRKIILGGTPDHRTLRVPPFTA
jgi:Lysyl oxidase